MLGLGMWLDASRYAFLKPSKEALRIVQCILLN